MNTRIRAKMAISLSLFLAGTIALTGCCDPNLAGSPKASPASAPASGMPPLLLDSTACSKAPLAEPVPLAPPAPKRSRCFTAAADCAEEVQGDLVFNLGQNVISNSSSARLAGGLEKPDAFRLPSGVMGRCNPTPEKYYRKVAANQGGFTAAPAAYEPLRLPEPATSQQPEPVAIPQVEGYILTDTELESGPELYIPGQAVIEPEPAPTQQALPPADAVLRPPVVEERREEAPQLAIPPLTQVRPEPAPEPSASTAFPADAAQAGTGYNGTLPPVPQVSDMDDAVDAVLTRERRVNLTGPTVQLPPNLN